MQFWLKFRRRLINIKQYIYRERERNLSNMGFFIYKTFVMGREKECGGVYTTSLFPALQ